eukprot:1159145-Pelagomonas_calceolata.AAC.10
MELTESSSDFNDFCYGVFCVSCFNDGVLCTASGDKQLGKLCRAGPPYLTPVLCGVVYLWCMACLPGSSL